MRLLSDFLRVYSYIFETVLCGMGLLLCGFSLTTSNVAIQVPWLPWSGAEQIRWILGLSIAGIASVWLAAIGAVRVLLFLFSGAVVWFLVRGLFLTSQYTFTGRNDARNALVLVFAALVALIGAYPGFGAKRKRA